MSRLARKSLMDIKIEDMIQDGEMTYVLCKRAEEALCLTIVGGMVIACQEPVVFEQKRRALEQVFALTHGQHEAVRDLAQLLVDPVSFSYRHMRMQLLPESLSDAADQLEIKALSGNQHEVHVSAMLGRMEVCATFVRGEYDGWVLS